MKVLVPAVVLALCAAARSVDGAESRDPARTPASVTEAPPRLQPLRLAAEREDPAHPVAAAATDPNEAAMRIKPQDLLPTDRPALHPAIHHAQRPGRDTDGDDDDGRRPRGTSSNSSGNRQKPKDGERSGGKDQRPTAKDGRSLTKDAKGQAKDGKDKKTHTGLDGKEVSDDDGDDVDSDNMDAAHKKALQIKHIQARQRKWRTGKPAYNYNQAIEGWKEVGPMYYYKGKYENAAAHRAPGALPAVVAVAAAASAACALLLR
ncbi:hypothetical protein H4R19_002064 [Coemansia spiralis]|nr:hypothetical protein H4R19_002064 [Coemansia spiralis]